MSEKLMTYEVEIEGDVCDVPMTPRLAGELVRRARVPLTDIKLKG
jgi:hypothetical protein